MEPTQSELTPLQAAQALRGLEGYEERLSSRAAGLTNMIWGLATAGIFLTYGSATDWAEAQGLPWLLALLWIPWVAAGITTTGAIWNAHAVSLGRDRDHDNRKSLLMSLGYTVGFLALMGAVFAIAELVIGLDWDFNVIMVLVSALFAWLVSAGERGSNLACSRHTSVAALAMAAAALVMGLVGLANEPANLLGATVVGGAWFASGIVTFTKG